LIKSKGWSRSHPRVLKVEELATNELTLPSSPRLTSLIF